MVCSLGTDLSSWAKALASFWPVLVFSMFRCCRSGMRYSCRARSVIPLPSGLWDKSRTVSRGTCFSEDAKREHSRSSIRTRDKVKYVNSGTWRRLAAKILILPCKGQRDTFNEYMLGAWRIELAKWAASPSDISRSYRTNLPRFSVKLMWDTTSFSTRMCFIMTSCGETAKDNMSFMYDNSSLVHITKTSISLTNEKQWPSGSSGRFRVPLGIDSYNADVRSLSISK